MLKICVFKDIAQTKLETYQSLYFSVTKRKQDLQKRERRFHRNNVYKFTIPLKVIQILVKLQNWGEMF